MLTNCPDNLLLGLSRIARSLISVIVKIFQTYLAEDSVDHIVWYAEVKLDVENLMLLYLY